MNATMALAAVNAMPRTAFAKTFGGVAEHSPWVAERAAARRPFASREAMAEAFAAEIRAATPAAQLALLNAHPDLAGRAAIAGDLTAASRAEQAGAGLDRLTPDEHARFLALNAAYTEKFGFPFILAVKGADKHAILAAFEVRAGAARDTEFAMALEQVCRIVRFRLEAMVEA
jgi:2-oxo-4-hydroxy-4-carboxy-5-ureidoimidazoline decarboxylase